MRGNALSVSVQLAVPTATCCPKGGCSAEYCASTCHSASRCRSALGHDAAASCCRRSSHGYLAASDHYCRDPNGYHYFRDDHHPSGYHGSSGYRDPRTDTPRKNSCRRRNWARPARNSHSLVDNSPGCNNRGCNRRRRRHSRALRRSRPKISTKEKQREILTSYRRKLVENDPT